MKKLKYLPAVFLIMSGLLTGFSRSDKNTGEQKVYLQSDALEKVTISSGSGDFYILPSNGDVPYVEMQTKIRGIYFGAPPSLNVSQEEDSTDIKITSKGWGIFGSAKSRISLYLPTDCLKELKADIGSGSFSCGELSLDHLDLHLFSGNAEMDFVSANAMDLSVSSGSLSLSNANAETMELSLASGDVEITVPSGTPAFAASVASGSLSFEGGISQGELKCSSGNIEVISSALPETLVCRVSSGDVHLELPDKEEGFTVSSKTASGSFYNQFSHREDGSGRQVTGRGEKQYEFKVSSGRLTLSPHK